MTTKSTRPTTLRTGLTALAIALLATSAVQAQGIYPNQPVSLIVPFPAGSVTDNMFRAISLEASKRLGQQIVIINKPGATGTLGPSTMAKTAKPDGYTLSVVPSSLVGLPHIQKVSYDALKDFTYIIGLTGYTFGLIVRNDSPVKNLDEYIAQAKAAPGNVTFASSGIGGGTHLAMAQLELCEKIKLSHITFKGGADATVAMLGGHVASQADGAWAPLVDAGQARLLMILTPNRVPQYPDVKTLKERCPDVSVDAQVIGIAGPRDMVPQVAQKIHDAFRDAMGSEGFTNSMKAAKQLPIYLSGKDYTAYMEKTFADKGALVKVIKLTAE
jgi:tripartite-type tricarboxylate transporter receptor subunit TctC